ncbi:MAG: HRDC domain-containing protein [Bacteroidaceae bacterium]|nr:HRDC domain-containing protein [Bacteroidaceae bacterium]
MQVKLFTIPVFGSEQIEEELNKFLRSHRILQVERHFCPDNGGYWALMVEYVAGDPIAESPPSARRERKDFSEGMTEEEKQRFELYKGVRRELAQQLAIPAYLVFTNEELAILARLPEVSDETIRGLKGIAPQRMKDYVRYFYGVANHAEASGQPDAEDSQP